MASEFDFLRGKWPKLAAIAADASRLVDIIPESAMKSLEKFAMWSADIALDIYEIQVPGGATQLEKLEALQACGYVPVEILQKYHNVRTAASRTVSDVNSATDLANACLSDCREVGQWLSRESEKSGFAPTQQFTPEYRVPISGMKHHMPEAEMMSNEYKANRFMRQYGSYIVLFVAVLFVGAVVFGITKLIGGKASEDQTTFIAIATPEVTSTPPPVTIADATEEVDTIIEPEYVLIDHLPIAIKFEVAELHISEWDVKGKRQFQNANKVYESGLGMFLLSDDISKEWGNDEMTYNLNGLYEKIHFEIFVDTEGSYGIYSEYGLFEIYMYADGVKIYDSERMFYNESAEETIILPDGTLQLKIFLAQQKGSKGTLDVVIGDFFLYPYEDDNN